MSLKQAFSRSRRTEVARVLVRFLVVPYHVFNFTVRAVCAHAAHPSRTRSIRERLGHAVGEAKVEPGGPVGADRNRQRFAHPRAPGLPHSWLL